MQKDIFWSKFNKQSLNFKNGGITAKGVFMKRKVFAGNIILALVFGLLLVGCEDDKVFELYPPGSPNIRAESTATTITLSWDAAASDILDYRFLRANSAEGPFTNQGTVNAPSIITELSITGLLPDNTFYFKIIATNGAGSSRATELTVSTRTEDEVDIDLNAPTNFRVTATAPSQLTLAFDVVTGATGYELAFASDADGPWTNHSGGTGTSRSIGSLNVNTTYYFRVRTLSYSVVSEWSAVLDATTSAIDAPDNIIVNNITATSMRISWDSVRNVSYYQVQRATSTAGPWQIVSSYTSSLFMDVTGLTPNTAYYFRVRASNNWNSNDDNSSEWVTTDSFTTDEAASSINAPSNLVVISATQSSITVSHDSVNGATSYELAFSTSAAGPWTNHSNTSSTSRNIGGLNLNTTYYFRVRTLINSDVSEWSSVINGATLALNVPGNVSINSITSNGMRITWDSVLGASYYQVQRATSTAGPWQIVSSYTSSLFMDVTGLTPNTTYYFSVRSSINWNIDDDNSSEWAIIGPFTTLTPPTASLTAAIWANGNATNADRVFWYTFDVVDGEYYYIWGNTQWSGDGTMSVTSSPTTRIINSDGTVITTMYPSWGEAQNFMANQTGTIKLEVSFNSNGTFAIAYNTINTRP